MIKIQNGNCNDSWSQSVRGRIFSLETGLHFMCLKASPCPGPGTCFKAGTLLSYKCDSDSSNSPKCSELLPV